MPKAIDRRRLGTSNDADALLWLRIPERAWTMFRERRQLRTS
jgi:hypothetical protein